VQLRAVRKRRGEIQKAGLRASKRKKKKEAHKQRACGRLKKQRLLFKGDSATSEKNSSEEGRPPGLERKETRRLKPGGEQDKPAPATHDNSTMGEKGLF